MEIVVRDQQNQVAYHYRVQDSPGRSCWISGLGIFLQLNTWVLWFSQA